MILSPSELQAVGPRLEAWLTHVFRVMGGYIFATGILAVTLAATSFRARHALAVWGAMLGGASSIGLMAAVNFAIGSDFKWVLLAMALTWAGSIAAYMVEGFRGASERGE
jgi:CDP-diglyceride synthetase